MPRCLALLVSACALAVCVNAAATPPVQAALAKLPHVSFPAAQRVAAGAIGRADIAALQQAGVQEVINLRAPEETPGFDEAAAMREAGIAYRNLPIRGAADLTRANVARFDQLLEQAGDRLTLVHCASSNRVGAMIALRAALVDGATTAEAIAEGRRWGLKGLEPAVHARLQEWSAGNTAKPDLKH